MILWPSSMASLKKIMSLARKTSLPTNLIQMQTKSTAAKDRRYGKKKIKKESSNSNFVKGWRLRQIFQTFLRIHYSGIVDWLIDPLSRSNIFVKHFGPGRKLFEPNNKYLKSGKVFICTKWDISTSFFVSCCGAVARAVASDTRDPWFESSHQ